MLQRQNWMYEPFKNAKHKVQYNVYIQILGLKQLRRQTRLKSACQIWVWAMAQKFFYGFKSHFLGVWAMAQSLIIDLWLGSKSNNLGVWAMAQSSIICMFEP